MKTVTDLSVWFLKQNRSIQLLIGGIGSIVLTGVCGLFSVIFIQAAQPSPSTTPTQSLDENTPLMTQTPVITTTAIPFSTATILGPTQTPLPTGLPTQSLETATIVVLPTKPISSVPAADIHVVITAVNKELEYVDIQNVGGSPVDLRGWELLSVLGNQSCILRGILQSKEVLRIWAGRNYPVGLSCGFYKKIWADEQLDPAVLYNARGEEVSHYP